MPIGEVWIRRLLFVILVTFIHLFYSATKDQKACYKSRQNTIYIHTCIHSFAFVRLRNSPPRIKLAASNFVRRFIGVPGKWGTLLPRSPKSTGESASARTELKLKWKEPSLACRPIGWPKSERRSIYSSVSARATHAACGRIGRHVWIYVSFTDVSSCS